ncbi:hypothetical protein VP01_2174g1 [Puccinia sorghi]|uniref:Uncharacterized protein n=1 Tax=Puccinia sorghi TaxID=27349 RepID=A0A0L6V9K3_9BASI|nr:hypothetical protein VP01_2174g1 [Puccinia sorghi]
MGYFLRPGCRANLDVELTEKLCCQVIFCLHEFQPTLCTAITDPLATQIPVMKNSFPSKRSIKEIKILATLHIKPPKISANIVATPQCVFLYQRILMWVTWLLSKSYIGDKFQTCNIVMETRSAVNWRQLEFSPFSTFH